MTTPDEIPFITHFTWKDEMNEGPSPHRQYGPLTAHLSNGESFPYLEGWVSLATAREWTLPRDYKLEVV